jgi:hypothetical protein
MHVASRRLAALALGVGALGGVVPARGAPTEQAAAEPEAPLVMAEGATPADHATAGASKQGPVVAVEPTAPPEEEDSDFDLPCIVIGRPGCGTQPLVELGMGWGESSSYVGTQWSMHGYIDAGLLVGLHDNFQLGPTAELGFDVGRVNSGYTLSTKLRARYWIGGWYVSLDGAAGAAFEHFTFDGGTENGTREGVVAELGLSVLGVLGPYAAVYALGDPGGRGSHEERWIVGFRGSIASWAMGIGAAFSDAPFMPLF